jgi:hypothetical protein
MAKKGLITKTKKTIVDVAKSGLEKTKPLAGAALGAATVATGVVLTGMALRQGQKKVEAATPMAKETVKRAATRIVESAKRKPASTKTKSGASKKRKSKRRR